VSSSERNSPFSADTEECRDQVLEGPSKEGELLFQKLLAAKIAKDKAYNAKVHTYNAQVPAKNAAIAAKNARRKERGRSPYGRMYEEEDKRSSCSQDTNVTVEEYEPVNVLHSRNDPQAPIILEDQSYRVKKVAKDGEYCEYSRHSDEVASLTTLTL
jgi:hypothetical protein